MSLLRSIKFIIIYLATLTLIDAKQRVNFNSDKWTDLNRLKPSVSTGTQQRAVQEMLFRLLPQEDAERFTVKVGDYPQEEDKVQIESSNNHVTIKGTSGVTVSSGVLYFLKHFCNAHISWEADQLTLPQILPSVNTTITIADKFRYYQNVCTLSYSMAWWKWERWEREIDWMALNGINLPLAFVGQEAIWRRVYLHLNLTHQDLDQHFAGPPFLAWGRMGNIRRWGGPLTQNWYQETLLLQGRILSRMRQFGMVPVLPGFAGHVPNAFKRVYPNSKVTDLTCWGHFNSTYSCTSFLDPTDPMFNTVGNLFIQMMTNQYNSTDHVYNADPFNEMVPTSDDTQYLAKVGESIFKAMTDADPQAIWLIQGWQFFHNQTFWKTNQTKALLTSVPLGRMLVLDLAAELAPQYSRFESFYGQPFIFCMLHNYGGVNGMYGMVDALVKNLKTAREWPNTSMVGIGITPEGINQNYVMYDFMLENQFHSQSINVSQWFLDYSNRRYGIKDRGLQTAWQLLMRSIYNDTTGLRNHGQYLAVTRPSLHKNKAIKWYSTEDVEAAWTLFMNAVDSNSMQQNKFYIWKEICEMTNAYYTNYYNHSRRNRNCNRTGPFDLKMSKTFQHDLVDLTRQVLQNYATTVILNIFDAYHRSNVSQIKYYGYKLFNIYKDWEIILGTSPNFLLGSWVSSASSWGVTEEEKNHYKYNALNQISLWGPDGNIRDYAIKQWAGVINDLTMPRWMLFIEMMIESKQNGIPFNEKLYRNVTFEKIENPFTFNVNRDFPDQPWGDTFEEAKRIYLKYHPKYQKFIL